MKDQIRIIIESLLLVFAPLVLGVVLLCQALGWKLGLGIALLVHFHKSRV